LIGALYLLFEEYWASLSMTKK